LSLARTREPLRNMKKRGRGDSRRPPRIQKRRSGKPEPRADRIPSRGGEHRGQEVRELDELGAHRAGFQGGAADDEGHAQEILVEIELVIEEIVVPDALAVIRGRDEERVVQQPRGLEFRAQLVHRRVGVRRLGAIQLPEPLRRAAVQFAGFLLDEPVAALHLGEAPRRRSLQEPLAIELRRIVRQVAGDVVDEEKERPFGRAPQLEELPEAIRDRVETQVLALPLGEREA